MPSVERVPYESIHFLEVTGDDHENRRYAKLHGEAGFAMTFMVDGRVAACGGVFVLWPGTAEMWVAISEPFLHSSRVIVEIKRQKEQWRHDLKLDRVQAMTPETWKTGRRFLEWLGMEYEGTLRKMGPHGIDQALYAEVH